MPDLPSLPYFIFERIVNDADRSLVLHVRKIYYPGGTEGIVYVIEEIPCRLKQNKNEILSSRDARKEKCRVVNDKGYIRAVQKLEEYRQRLQTQNDVFTRRLNEYYETVVGRYVKWYDEYNVTRPIIRQKWTGTKSEFARFIEETYEQQRDKYKSKSDATRKIFQQYTFDDPEWTWEDCNDLRRHV